MLLSSLEAMTRRPYLVTWGQRRASGETGQWDKNQEYQ
jgi:hypothetical protein